MNAVHECRSQCDGCHTPENCVPATRRLGDMILCSDCYSLRSAS